VNNGLIFRSSPIDDLVGLLKLSCVRLYVRKYVRPSVHKKSFFPISIIRCVIRSRPDMHTSLTSTRSKIKVKVTELLKFRKLHFSRSISSAILAWSSKLMVLCVNMGTSLQPNFWISFPESYHVTSKFAECWYYTNFKGHISVLLEARVIWSGMLVVYMYCACWCDLDPIQGQGQGQGHGAMTISPLPEPLRPHGDT